MYIKHRFVCKPAVIKAFVVSLSVKAVHLKLVSNLSTDAFIATSRRFIARCGKPSLIWNDYGSNFIGAAHEHRELAQVFEITKNTEHRFRVFPLHRVFSGSSFLSMAHILMVSGRGESRIQLRQEPRCIRAGKFFCDHAH